MELVYDTNKNKQLITFNNTFNTFNTLILFCSTNKPLLTKERKRKHFPELKMIFFMYFTVHTA